MTVLAYVFHWSPSEMKELSIDDLMAFHDDAQAILKAQNK
jgi:hypothetical protein